MGGSSTDILNRVEVTSTGEYILYGRSTSPNFPTINSLGVDYTGTALDLVIVKMSSDGQQLIFSSLFGGNGDDIAAGLKLDGDDNIIIGGMTTSRNYPIVGGVKNS